MLHVIHTFGDELPPTCASSCQEAWLVFDNFLAKYGSDYDIAERTTRVLRYGITLFGKAALSVSAAIVGRMSFAFEATGYPSYLWIAGKVISTFGNEDDQNLRGSFREIYDRSTNQVVSLLRTKSPKDIPDGAYRIADSCNIVILMQLPVLEDYVRMLLHLLEFGPDILFLSPTFPTAFRAAMAALTLIYSDVVFAALDFFRGILTHDCITAVAQPPPNFPLYQSAIQTVVEKEGFEFLGYLLGGLVGDFPTDSSSSVATIFRTLVTVWPSLVLAWLPPVLQHLPTTAVPIPAKAQFLSDVTRCVAVSGWLLLYS